MVRHNCAKCGSTDHSTAKCTSDTELREECICSEVEGLEWCGNHITKDKWNAGYRIHNKCKNFLAGAVSLLTLIGTCIPGRRATIKAPKKTNSGTGETRDRLRDEAQLRGEARRNAEGGGNSGPARKKTGERFLKEKMDATHFEAIMAAPLKPEQDKQGRWRIPRAGAIVKRIDLASPIAPRLKFRPPNKAGRSAREQNGDPTTSSGQPTPATVRSIDSLVWLCKMSRDGLPIQIWDAELKAPCRDEWKALVERLGLGGAYSDICWESAISKAPCRPCAEISRVAYDVADMSLLTIEKRWNADQQKHYQVCFGDVSVSKADQKAVLDERDPRLPLGYQNGPEREMGPFLREDIWLWDMYAALCRAAGHENGGAHNDLITMPFSSNSLALLFSRTFDHRAEPDVADEIWSVQELGTALYWLLRDDPLCSVDDIVNARFPGRDPTKWDFSSFDRSADATPSKKRKRAIDLTADESEDECEDEYASDYESDDE